MSAKDYGRINFLRQYNREKKRVDKPIINPPPLMSKQEHLDDKLEEKQPQIIEPEVSDEPNFEDKIESEGPTGIQTTSQTTTSSIKATINQQTMDEYNDFVKKQPDLLPDSNVFKEISKLWLTINKNMDGTDMTDDEKHEDKESSLEKLFNINEKTLELFNAFINYPINTPLPFTISVANNKDTNLIYYFTKVLFFQNRTPPYNETGIDIKWIKRQLGKDLHRMNIYINKTLINKDIWFLDPGINVKIKEGDENTDTFNMLLIEEANKNKTTISLDLITLFDIASIQQMIQYANDSIVGGLAHYGIMLKGGDKTLNITITSTSKTVVWDIVSRLVNVNDVGDALSLDLVKPWGFLISKLTMNLNNLSYSLTSTIQKDMSNMGEKAVNYIKENPSKVATGVTVAAVLGTMPLYLPALLALGGKSKKNLHNKHKNIKTRRKNKRRKTRKYIKKNKRRKTRKYNN